MRSNRGKSVATVVVVVAVLMLAPVAHAAPVESGWAGWWADAWQSVLAVFGASSTETTEPEPEPVPPPKSEPPATTSDSCPTCGGGDTDGGPSLDPNG